MIKLFPPHGVVKQQQYFYDVALKTGIDRIGTIARDLGLGQLFDFELPNSDGFNTTYSYLV